MFKTPSFLTTAALSLSSWLYDLTVIKRRSRKHEMEADIMGLQLAAITGYQGCTQNLSQVGPMLVVRHPLDGLIKVSSAPLEAALVVIRK